MSALAVAPVSRGQCAQCHQHGAVNDMRIVEQHVNDFLDRGEGSRLKGQQCVDKWCQLNGSAVLGELIKMWQVFREAGLQVLELVLELV